MKKCFDIIKLNLHYGSFHALKDIDMQITKGEVTAFIGPSGCGKSTFIKTLNRMNDLIEDCKISGEILFHDRDIYSKNYDINLLRKRVGMVFQKPNPFAMSIYDNITFGPKTHGIKDKDTLDIYFDDKIIPLKILVMEVELFLKIDKIPSIIGFDKNSDKKRLCP